MSETAHQEESKPVSSGIGPIVPPRKVIPSPLSGREATMIEMDEQVRKALKDPAHAENVANTMPPDASIK